ncbi:hypothetical protein Vretifemale_11178 [Volvox reticuliferus]|uniref:Uncharacterized protein n=1 Tax=Volvox reticuliferus TaxID=1737510 RepID=A0A8J4CIE3_9CHLO|nr:hypothetical protein Vretifemale_11178 [Volvox reticuliferus]
MLFKAIAMPSAAAATATLPHATAAATATVAATAFTVRSTPRNFIPPPPSAARTSAGGGGGSAAGGSTNTSTTATSKWPHPIASLTGCGLPGLGTLEAAAAVAGQPAVLAAAGRTAAGPSGGREDRRRSLRRHQGRRRRGHHFSRSRGRGAAGLCIAAPNPGGNHRTPTSIGDFDGDGRDKSGRAHTRSEAQPSF